STANPNSLPAVPRNLLQIRRRSQPYGLLLFIRSAIIAQTEPSVGSRPEFGQPHWGRLPSQHKSDSDRGIDFDRIAVELSGLIAPLLHSIQSGLHQQRVAGN